MKHHLDFEKPIIELQRKLEELKTHPENHSLEISLEAEIQQIERKIEEERRRVFSDLSACTPATFLSRKRQRGQWTLVDYATEDGVTGTMVFAYPEEGTGPLTLPQT